MASDKPVTGPEPQPAGLIPVGASSTGGASAPSPALAAVAGGGGGGSSSAAVMGELRASGSGSVVLPAGMINPSVPIRNIRMKFAVLIGLIQVGEVSNRDIVETVLNLVRGLHPTSRGTSSLPPLPHRRERCHAPLGSPCLVLPGQESLALELPNSTSVFLSAPSSSILLFHPSF